jgi:hypothetical protein
MPQASSFKLNDFNFQLVACSLKLAACSPPQKAPNFNPVDALLKNNLSIFAHLFELNWN